MNDEELIKETMMLDYSQLVMHNVYMIKENKRLNNIINSMNDYLVMNIANGGLDFMYRQGFKDSYKKLQKLKGSDKE